jgi:hypothetical protein
VRDPEPVNDESLAAELLDRMERDQQARTRQPPDPEEMAAVDADNTAWLAGVIDRRGWPLRSRVGDRAATAAWLLAQHAEAQLDLQRQCLQLLTDAADRGEADPGNLAYLTDRVLCAEGQPQRYGTQFWTGSDGTIAGVVDDAAVGLDRGALRAAVVDGVGGHVPVEVQHRLHDLSQGLQFGPTQLIGLDDQAVLAAVVVVGIESPVGQHRS